MPKLNQTRQSLRIIGGQWRGRRLSFVSAEGLRPTPDRVRETVFNWLLQDIEGAVCCDCFAGSGALGFEAASRGASHVLMIDSARPVVTQLKSMVKELDAGNISVQCATMPSDKLGVDARFNVVFIDPPYASNLVLPTIEWLMTNHRLAPGALIYIERSHARDTLVVPESWQRLKHKRIGGIEIALYSA